MPKILLRVSVIFAIALTGAQQTLGQGMGVTSDPEVQERLERSRAATKKILDKLIGIKSRTPDCLGVRSKAVMVDEWEAEIPKGDPRTDLDNGIARLKIVSDLHNTAKQMSCF